MTPVLVVKNGVAHAVDTLHAVSELLVVGYGAVVLVVAVVTDVVLGALVKKVDVLFTVGKVGFNKPIVVFLVVVFVGVNAVVFKAVEGLDTVVVVSMVRFDAELIEIVVAEYAVVLVAVE